MSAARRLAAEFTGTALLLAAVVGSGIMGESLAGGNVAIALLANTVATGAALVALILAFGQVSGGHLTRPSPSPTPGRAACAGARCPVTWRRSCAERSSASWPRT
jgi:hypothetical protein